jgi:hypothetical protein
MDDLSDGIGILVNVLVVVLLESIVTSMLCLPKSTG